MMYILTQEEIDKIDELLLQSLAPEPYMIIHSDAELLSRRIDTDDIKVSNPLDRIFNSVAKIKNAHEKIRRVRSLLKR